MVCSAAAFHSPDDLVVAVLAGDDTLPQWDWLKWLPHAQSTEETDAVGPSRMVTTSLDDLGRDAARRPRRPAAVRRRPAPGDAARAARWSTAATCRPATT